MTVATEELTVRLADLVDRMAKGEAVTITRQGIPVAQLIPAPETRKMTSAEAVEHLKELRKGVRLNGLSIRELINEGRK